MKELTLYQLTAQQQAIEDALLENGGELTPELVALMDENTTAMETKVQGYNYIIRRCEGYAQVAKTEKARMAALQKSYENAAKSIKAHLKDTMETFGIDRIETPTCKAFLKNNPEAVTITDEDALLKPYKAVMEVCERNLPAWVKVSYDIDKTALKEAIRAGEPVFGAEITTSKGITIK